MNQQCWIARGVQELRRHDGTLNRLSGFIALRQKKDVIMESELDLRQPFSSLLSKQSGSPSHCHPPGTHFPSPHMKFPGMLHSVVKLFPGSSWLSVWWKDRMKQGGGDKKKKKSITISLHNESKQRDIAFQRYSSPQSKDPYYLHFSKIEKY